MGRYLKQIRGPARGIYQMEPGTYDDIWRNFLIYHPELGTAVSSFAIRRLCGETQICGNIYLATAMARIHYFRVREALPKADDVAGLAAYWKHHYNTRRGRGTKAQFMVNYKRLVTEGGKDG